jgi:hypothetical protein
MFAGHLMVGCTVGRSVDELTLHGIGKLHIVQSHLVGVTALEPAALDGPIDCVDGHADKASAVGGALAIGVAAEALDGL